MAKKKFPGPIACGLLKDADIYYAATTMGSRICVAWRQGPVVGDYDGFQFIDFHCDASVNNLGGDHPAINRAISAQKTTGNIFSEHHNAPNSSATELAKLLAEKSPVPKPAKVYFGNSGTEANETALKLCRALRKERGEYNRQTVIYFKNAFHGRTLGILPGTNSKPEVQRDPFWTQWDAEHSIYIPYPAKGADAGTFREYLASLNPATINALFIELPCQGEGGIIPADDGCVKCLFETCRDNDIFVIVDAIQCGMGRAGSLFGTDRYSWIGLKPDILTLGKALGGGLPIGVTIFRAELDFAKPGMHSSTFGGGPMVARAGLAVLSEIDKLLAAENGKLSVVQRLEDALQVHLTELQKKFPEIITEARGIGAMWAHEIAAPELRDEIIKRGEDLAAEETYGLRLLGAGRKTVRFMPPLNISPDMLDTGLSLYEKVLSSL